ncbi:MAG: DUF3530 family protein [Gammaproteobacteria bacterium]
MIKYCLHLLIGLVALSGTALASDKALTSDKAKEQRWAEQIVDAIMVGEPEWLELQDHKILGIYTEATTPTASGGALVLHGSGVHPDWPDVIYPLRTQLPDHGWHTLAIQMPVLANEAEYDDYAPLFAEVAPRIEAGIKYLQDKGIQNIVIIAHSLGTTMSAHYLASSPNAAVRAFVAVGMPGQHAKAEAMNNLKSLEKISLPLLDIYGSEDLESILKTADQRASAAKRAGNTAYSQVEVPGANHFFNGQGDTLVKRVRGWLAKHAAGTEIQP